MDLIAARLGYIGAIIATIGDGVAAIAAGIALRKLEEASLAESRSEVDQFRQTENIQQQVDFYINELIQIRKMIK
ncbi:translation initiation factor 2 [Paenibacillus glycanilyticus]|uniref:translation initiation factor 2 n=1 Tax=Paenibacillus glycanilyticus TaxID=126569 RepID=UPI0019100163|nr:translation initiation factor 2 [Paenibacillus glycanilyticus]